MSTPAGDALAAIDLVAGAGLSLVLRGPAGPVTDLMMARLAARRSLLRLPATADLATLDGGLDALATLAAGHPVHRPGFADRIAGRVVVVPGAERLGPALAARLAGWIDTGVFAGGLVLLDEGDDPALPPLLADRTAMQIDTASFGWRDWQAAQRGAAVTPGDDDSVDGPALMVDDSVDGPALMVAVADRLGITSLRAPLMALAAARAVGGDHALAARLVLAPRATVLPPQPAPTSDPAPAPDPAPADQQVAQRPGDAGAQAERLVEAVRIALPAELLAGSSIGRAGHPAGSAPAHGGDNAARGRLGPLRPGVPARGGRLDLVATLVAAVPHQRWRGRADRPAPLIRREDLRIRRREPRRRHATVIAVDASGSAAMARLGEVKGAIEQLLASSYVRRDEVALIAFRGNGASTLLPPTRSLARARRELSALPGGGGTPLAAGILTGIEQAVRSRREGRSVQLVLLTDGGANIARDGSADRVAAARDATAAAQQVAALGITSLVIDASPRGAPVLRGLAASMNARYLALPRADDQALAAAIGSSR